MWMTQYKLHALKMDLCYVDIVMIEIYRSKMYTCRYGCIVIELQLCATHKLAPKNTKFPSQQWDQSASQPASRQCISNIHSNH